MPKPLRFLDCLGDLLLPGRKIQNAATGFFFAELGGCTAWLSCHFEEDSDGRRPSADVASAFAKQIASGKQLLCREVEEALRRAGEIENPELVTIINPRHSYPMVDESSYGDEPGEPEEARGISKVSAASTKTAASAASMESNMSKFSWWSQDTSQAAINAEGELELPSLTHIADFLDEFRQAEEQAQLVVVATDENYWLYDLVLVGAALILLRGWSAKGTWAFLTKRTTGSAGRPQVHFHEEGVGVWFGCLLALQKLQSSGRPPSYGSAYRSWLKMCARTGSARLAEAARDRLTALPEIDHV
eukprot:TRINITY_DN28962_c0_g1_i1.p1 TRINITY_DN28962_c0_g1~~TRINITY_DN28962_c0_g1_i1.p1  ORF type:complete len:303 (-),score=58.38 TRINITY_DN28962_c0_g1_i1:19-927(-)